MDTKVSICTHHRKIAGQPARRTEAYNEAEWARATGVVEVVEGKGLGSVESKTEGEKEEVEAEVEDNNPKGDNNREDGREEEVATEEVTT